MILSNTNKSTNSAMWAAPYESTVNIPNELILDMQVTSPRYVDVYLTSCKIGSGTVNLILRDGTNSLIGTISTSTTGIPVSFNCEDGYTANVLLGDIPNFREGDIITNRIRINPVLISVYGQNTSESSQTLRIVQDGVVLRDEVMTSDILLRLGDDLNGDFTAGELSISLLNPGYIAQAAESSTQRNIRSINGISANSLQLDIIVNKPNDAGEGELVVTAEGNVITLDSTAYSEYLAAEDPLDSRISPSKRSADYEYCPLDDAYTRIGATDKTWIRDVTQLGGVYLLTGQGSDGPATGYEFATELSVVDANYDVVEDKNDIEA